MDSLATRIEIVPNCSLTPAGATRFFVGTCAVSLGIAGALALLGYWPVLPFAGLEMLVLGWALRASMSRRNYSEIITVTDDRVAVETCKRGAPAARAEFPRHWAQVRLRGGLAPLHPSRLTIESHGRHCEIGSFLTEQERRSLAGRLTRLIGPVNQSPQLAG